MLDNLLIATAHESLSLTEPLCSITEPERALQLYEAQTGYGQWKVIFPGSVVLSDKAAAMLGLTARETAVPLQDMVGLYHAEDRGKLLTLIAQALQHRRGFRCRLRVERGDGEVRMIESIADLRIRDGRVTELFGASRDVTGEMERELQLEAQLKLIAEMVSEMPSPVIAVDDQLRVLDCSIPWLKAHRFTERREVVGKTLLQLFPEMPAVHRAEYEAALRGQTVRTRRSFVSPSTDMPAWFSTIITPLPAGERQAGGFTISVGWSEIAVAKAPPKVLEELVADFDGTLLDLLKTVI